MSAHPIFITGRFRSGSTLLWNIFDTAPGFSAYYEPCHDNLVAHIQHTRPMASHRGVGDYWGAYQPMLGKLADFHSPQFGLTRLLLEQDDTWPELSRYIRFLIESAGRERAVLQFNRVDFRLPWLRFNFPEARIVHIWRDARETFASSVRHLPPERIDDPAEDDMYDQLQWSASLSRQFPFLASESVTTSYHRIYYLWKLSLLMGRQWSDVSISFDEDILADPRRGIGLLVSAGLLPDDQAAAALDLIQPIDRLSWRLLHETSWYDRIEAECNVTLDRLGLNDMFGRVPLREIRARRPDAWREADRAASPVIIDQILLALSRHRSEVTRLLHIVRTLEADRVAREREFAPSEENAGAGST
jgi:hypothetical protein